MSKLTNRMKEGIDYAFSKGMEIRIDPIGHGIIIYKEFTFNDRLQKYTHMISWLDIEMVADDINPIVVVADRLDRLIEEVKFRQKGE